MTISLSIEILKKNKLQIKIGSTERKLTSVNLYQSLDMSRPTVWYGSVVGATGTQINISDGINTQIYNGNFYYGSFGLSGGTINSTYYYYGGALIYSITSGSVDALTAFNFMNSGNALGLLGYVLSGSDSINGSFYNDTILGFSGNDLIYGNGGNDIIVGGGGNDTVAYNYNFNQYSIVPEAAGWLIVYGPEGIDCINQCEAIKFSDSTYNTSSFSTVSVIGGVYAAAVSKIDMRSLYVWTGQYTYKDSSLFALTDGTHTQASFGSFIYDVYGNPASGTIQSIAYAQSGVPTYTITGMNLNLFTYNNFIASNDVHGLATFILSGSDKLVGSILDDFIEGFAGNDTIDGGSGNDTAVYLSDFSSAQITKNLNGTYTVSTPIDGTDTLSNIEFLQFSDKTINLSANSAPTVTSGASASAAENVSTLTAVYVATATDPDTGTTLSYSISGGIDANLFNINSSSGAVTFKTSPDYETPADSGADNIYNIIVQASDGVLTATQAVAITVTDILEQVSLTSGNDNWTGRSNADWVLALGGDDTLSGLGGNDILDGGDGNDIIFGGDGDDTLTGGNGNDVLVGHDNVFAIERNNLSGGAGNDTFYIDATDTVDGGAGSDVVYLINDYAANIDLGATSIEWFRGGFGNDVVTAATQTVGVEVYAGGGNDTITGSAYTDFLWAGSGNDTINGGAGNDVIVADTGVDTVNGGDGNDSIYADASDTVTGGNGFDALYITGSATGMSINLATASFEFVADFVGGSDTLDGSTSTANLEIYAAGGNDTISGGSGSDFLWGQAGNDTITGGAGNDVLVGGPGSDRLTGGAGIDALFGNGGGGGDGAVDTFVFTPNWGTDFVFDFEHGTDKLDMSAIGTNFASLTLRNTSDGHCYVTSGSNLIAVANMAGQITSSDFLF